MSVKLAASWLYYDYVLWRNHELIMISYELRWLPSLFRLHHGMIICRFLIRLSTRITDQVFLCLSSHCCQRQSGSLSVNILVSSLTCHDNVSNKLATSHRHEISIHLIRDFYPVGCHIRYLIRSRLYLCSLLRLVGLINYFS